ncbi:MAG: histidine kinase N-terminal 7TM domain-containing protein, partial [Bacteroidota bacterium]
MIEIGSLPVCIGALEPSPVPVVPLILAVILVPLAIWVALLPRFSGQRALVIAHAAMVWWLFFAVLEIASPAADCKLLFGALVHGGVTLLPAAWLFFIARFTFGTSDAGRVSQDRLMLIAP